MALSWGVVIATKDRLAPLKTCVTLALGQSQPPAEIIIVDASKDWEDHATEIRGLLEKHPGIRLVYDPAPRPSSAVQRNCGIDQAQADILFLIDDDSFLYPDTVAQILAIYTADTEGCVAGIQLADSPIPPSAGPDAPRYDYTDFNATAGHAPWRRRLLRKLLVYGLEESFIPYAGRYADHPPPATLSGFDVRPARLFEGYRMTFRRAALGARRFDPLLLYYCPGEDLDLSHRLSETHCLLTSRTAKVHHFNSGDGRLKRRQVALLATLNQAVFLRQHAQDLARARRQFIWLTCRYIMAELIKDVGQGRFGLPKTRGRARALWLSRAVFTIPLAELEEFYLTLQQHIITGDS